MSKQSQALEKQYEKEEGISSVEESGGEDWYTPSFFEWLLEKADAQEGEIKERKADNAEMLLALNLCYCASQTGGIVQKEIDAIKAIIDRHTKE